jgi:hypothetical protein
VKAPVLFILFCLIVVGSLGYADYRGYALAGLFTTAQTAQRFATHTHK